MNRETVATAIIALLAVLALALAAATLDPIDAGGSLGTGEGNSPGIGDDDSIQAGGRPPVNDSESGGGSLPPLFGRLVLAVLAVMTLIAVYGLYRRMSPRELVGMAAGIVAVAVALYAVVYVLSRLLGGNSTEGQNGLLGRGPMELPGGGGGGLAGDLSGSTVSNPPLLVLAAFGLVLVGGAVVALRSMDADDAVEPTPVESDAETEADVAAIGRAAGRAADRIDDDAETGNEVYQAWEEMTELLEVANPRTSTPEEFATAAVDAGMDRHDVSQLTDLFREARYGGHRVTDDRATRAQTALRRIESEYAAESVERGRGNTTSADPESGTGVPGSETDVDTDGDGDR